MAPKAKPPAGQPEPLSYYKSNMNTIVGDGESIPWPAYTSRLDVEPERASESDEHVRPWLAESKVRLITG